MTDTNENNRYRARIVIPEEGEKTVTRARIVYAQPDRTAEDDAPRTFRVVYAQS